MHIECTKMDVISQASGLQIVRVVHEWNIWTEYLTKQMFFFPANRSKRKTFGRKDCFDRRKAEVCLLQNRLFCNLHVNGLLWSLLSEGKCYFYQFQLDKNWISLQLASWADDTFSSLAWFEDSLQVKFTPKVTKNWLYQKNLDCLDKT